ncbi:MAG: tautomerase family protein [Desulfuromonadaceae bacterium]|nr:tautomerase family protein [Desulfuromonadaceae bacterium]
MPHLQFEFNFTPNETDKICFATKIKEHFATIMDTGTDHIGVTLRCYGTHDLSFGHATSPADGIVFVNADIRGGRTSEQKRSLSLAFIDQLQRSFNVPPQNVYVILTEHPGEHFQLHDRVLQGWAQGEDPLADEEQG